MKKALIGILLLLHSGLALADYLDLSGQPYATSVSLSWNGYPGKTFVVKYKKSSEGMFAWQTVSNNVTESHVTVGAGYRWYYWVNGLQCNTSYDFSVRMKGRLERKITVRTTGCGSVACPHGGWYDGANCQIGMAPYGTTAFIWGGNYYHTALPGNACPYPGSWYDGANCFVQAVPAGVTPFIWANHWYYQAFP
ncbi:MAG: fibronectin type III domain-containing protein [Xanthomonadales bacterium]|nr:fibronectin type III domain-containing protein [Xanthomonadales bacterium]